MSKRLCNERGKNPNCGLVKDSLLDEGNGDGERGESTATSDANIVRELNDSLDRAVLEEETGQATGKLNPLLSEDILEHVLGNIVGQTGPPGMSRDVQNIRLVSSLWQEVATRLYRRSPRAPELIFGNHRRRFGWEEDRNGGHSIAKLAKFLEAMKETTMIPYQRFTIVDFQVYSEPTRGKMMKEFLQLCGSDATFLKLIATKTATALTPEWCLPEDLKFTKLQTLEVTFEYFPRTKIAFDPRDPATIAFADFIGFILLEAQNLRELKFQSNFPKLIFPDRWESDPLDVTLNKCFGETICSRIPGTVKKLSLGMSLSDLNLVDLAKLGLKLEEFCASIIPGNETTQKFLEAQVETLQSLSIEGWRLADGRIIPTGNLLSSSDAVIDGGILDDLLDELPWIKTNPKCMELLQRNIRDTRPRYGLRV